MDQVLTNPTKKILYVCFVIILLCSSVIIFTGFSIRELNNDVKRLENFLEDAEGLQEKFGDNLLVYTQIIETAHDHLLSLRPSTEQEYIEFISKIEELGEKLFIQLDLRSGEPTSNTLNYIVSFEANLAKTKSFIEEINKMPYYVQIDSFDFTSPVVYTETRRAREGNVNISITLYIK